MIKVLILPLVLFVISVVFKFNSFIKVTYGIILAVSLAVIIIIKTMKKNVN
jgi:hypothetical protein